MFQYRIQPGDNIYRIANYFDISVPAILAANAGLLPNQIFPGQIILIPISGYLYQNYPWYYLLPYLFTQQPRHYWDDRGRWPREWHDRDGRDRWDGTDRRDGRDRRGGGGHRGGRGRNYMGKWDGMLLAQALNEFEDDQWRDMYDQSNNGRNDVDAIRDRQPGMQPDIYPEQETPPDKMKWSGIWP